MKLRDIAHSRTGDKGTIVNISLIAFDARDYPRLCGTSPPSGVKAHFAELVAATSSATSCRRIGALNFVLHGVVGGGVTRTLALDAHGKSLQFGAAGDGDSGRRTRAGLSGSPVAIAHCETSQAVDSRWCVPACC